MPPRRDKEERHDRRSEESREFDSQVLDLARVTRVTKGGKRMRFRATVILGDRKGRVGFGIAKGVDVAGSVSKATRQAQKHVFKVSLKDETIPHVVRMKYSASEVLIKPAPQGTGIKAGGAARVVLEMAGVPNVVAKMLGSANKINNVKATVLGLQRLRASPVRPQREKV